MWGTAIIDSTRKITSAMIGNTGGPYVALSDSGARTYWPSATEVGRLTVTIPSDGFNPGTYVYPCPVGAQPSNAGTDDPMQLALSDGRWIDIFGVQNATVTWSGNNGTAIGNGNGGSGITIKNWQTGTGWPSGTVGNVNKFGFTASGASVAAGCITAEDKKLGYIAHAVPLLFNNAGLANGPWLPALRQDSPQSGPYPAGNTYYHQGTRLALIPGTTRPAGFSTMDDMVCDAFENYGGFVCDRTGGFTIRCNGEPEPGTGVSLTTADFAGVTSMSAGRCGKFLVDNLVIVTNSDPALGF